MKKTILLCALLGIGISSYAQSEPSFSLQELKTKEDMNPVAQKAITYILSTPADTTNKMRKDAEDYLMIWMEKTEDYSFAIDQVGASLLDENKEEAFVFFAGMAQAMFTDKNMSTDQVRLYAAKKLIQYTTTSRNRLQPGAALSKMIQEDKKGKLSEHLKEVAKM